MKRVVIWAIVGLVVGSLIARSIASGRPIDPTAAGVTSWDHAVARWEAVRTQMQGVGAMIGVAVGGFIGYMWQRSKDPEWRLIGAWKYPQIYEGDDPPPPPPLLGD